MHARILLYTWERKKTRKKIMIPKNVSQNIYIKKCMAKKLTILPKSRYKNFPAKTMNSIIQ